MIKKSCTSIRQWWCNHQSAQSRFSKEEALDIARAYNLESEIKMAIQQGYSPDEALQDWDIYPYNNKI